MDGETMEEFETTGPERPIERGDTGVRILLSLLFVVIWALVESAIGAIVVFSVAWALITQSPPPRRIRAFANRAVAYGYEIGRYLSYNEPRVPFPFSDFPEARDPVGDPGQDESREVHDLLRTTAEEDDD